MISMTHVALPLGKNPVCPLTRRLVCTFRKRKKFFLYLRDSKSGPYYTYDSILVHQKEAVVAYFKIGSPNLPGGTEEENENPESEKSVRRLGLNGTPPHYKSKALPFEPIDKSA